MGETTESVRRDAANREIEQKEKVDWRGKDFKQLVYGHLYENNDAGTEIDIVDLGTFYPWVSSTVGLSSGIDYVVVSAASDNITIGTSGGGIYHVSVHTCFGGDNNSLIHGHVFKDGAETILQFHRKLAGADIGSASSAGLLELVSGDVLDLRFTSDTDNTTLILHHVGLTLIRISA